MQRIIKFRQAIFVEGKLSGWHYWGFIGGIFVNPLPLYNTAQLKVKPSQQFIEHHDKNGVEGYFDDLVRWGYSVYQVMWNYEEGIAQLIKCSGGEAWSRLPIEEIRRGEIIGNIYESPQLLANNS